MRKNVEKIHDLRDLVRRECFYLFNQFLVLHDFDPLR